MDDNLALPSDLKKLYYDLIRLNTHLNEFTYEKYKRINPFMENVIDWHQKAKRYNDDDSITIYDSATLIGDVNIGNNTWIGPFCMLDGGGVNIGKYCSISSAVMIFTHDTVKWALSGGKEKYEYAATSIGDNCFIGTQAVILKGVTIGDCCLIAANSLVNKNLPNNSIAGGVPAKIIGQVVNTGDSIELVYYNK